MSSGSWTTAYIPPCVKQHFFLTVALSVSLVGGGGGDVVVVSIGGVCILGVCFSAFGFLAFRFLGFLAFWLLGFLAFRLLGFLAFWLLVGIRSFWWLSGFGFLHPLHSQFKPGLQLFASLCGFWWLWLFTSSAFPVPLRFIGFELWLPASLLRTSWGGLFFGLFAKI